MKKKRRIIIYCFALMTVFTLAWGLQSPSNASLYPNLSPNGLTIQGQTQTVSTSQLSQPIQTVFTFKTTDSQYEGYMGGDYILQYDPQQMDIDLSSFYQHGVYAPNGNINNFTANGQPATPGMVWISCSNPLPSQGYDLRVNFINLFKDGKRRPAEIKILNVTESEFTVSITGTNGNQLDNVSYPVIHSSYIELADITIKIDGVDTLIKGGSATYQASVENTLVDNGVIWSVEGNDSMLTQIDQTGNLVVDAKETATTIDIVATSKEDGTVIARKTVTLEDIPVPVLSIEGKEEVYKGKTGYEYITKLEGSLYPNVEWSIVGEHHPQTSINPLGILTIDILEEKVELTLCATSKEDGTIVAYKKVKVIEEKITGDILGKDEVIQGTNKEAYEFVSENIGNQSYYWKLVGGSSSDTSINEVGEVSIGIDEVSQEVELQVYLSGKDTLIASKKVRVIERTYIITDIKLKYPNIWLSTSQNKSELIGEIEKNQVAIVTFKTMDGKLHTIEVPILSYSYTEEIMNEEGLLNQGEYGIVYTLDLPRILESGNGKIEYVEGITNLIGGNTVELKAKIFLEEKEPTNVEQPKEETVVSKKNEVDTSDRSFIFPFLMTGYISLLVILVEVIRWRDE